MKRTIYGVIALAGIAGTVAVPQIVSGNSRRDVGSLAALQQAETPYVAHLAGANEVPGPGDTDGMGGATVSFSDLANGTETQVCWDLSYSGIAEDPTMAHIHRGEADESGDVVVDFGDPTPNAYGGCVDIDTALADEIQATPADFYVNVHTADFTAGAIRGQLAKGPASAGSQHFLATPLRAYDSRIAPATRFAAGETRTISLATGEDLANATLLAVPPGATAAIVTITATATGGPGYVTAYSAASPTPATSNLNFTASGATVAVSTQVGVDSTGSIKLTTGPAGTDLIVDVIGYLY